MMPSREQGSPGCPARLMEVVVTRIASVFDFMCWKVAPPSPLGREVFLSAD